MSYVHSHPYYWDNVVNFGTFGMWDSVTTANAWQWGQWYLGSQYNLPYTIPGCSPQDFAQNAWWLWMADDGTFSATGAAGFGPYSWGSVYGAGGLTTRHPWTNMRKLHNIMGITVAEAMSGVGLPVVGGGGPAQWTTGASPLNGATMLDPLNSIAVANHFFPQYANVIGSPNGVTGWANNLWLQYDELPYIQISNGNPPNQCAFWFRAFIYYLNRIGTHIHGNTPGSWSGVQLIASGPYQGMVAKIWIYKYLNFLSKAHWAQTGSEGCGCNSITPTIHPIIWSQLGNAPSWFHGW